MPRRSNFASQKQSYGKSRAEQKESHSFSLIAIEDAQLVNSQYETVLPTGVVTTITDIEADGAADGQMYYNTVGIGVKKPTRGVYITNGAKIVVK